MKKLLVGTGNKTRLLYIKGILENLGIHIIGLNDMGITFRVEENGVTPLENSLEKALGYHKVSGMPTLAIDAGLYIDSFPDTKQPGLFVKRIGINKAEATDEEMLDYYVRELNKYGGTSKGYWEIGISLVCAGDKIYNTIFQRRTQFTAIKSQVYTENEPLNAIQIDLRTGKYVSELSVKEKMKSQTDLVEHIYQFVEKNLM